MSNSSTQPISEQFRAKPSIAYFTVATAGHVDHGKTSLIKALTGINPDRLKEEQERQMTTDLGFAHMLLHPGQTKGKKAPSSKNLDENQPGQDTIGLGFIDVPGHGKFIKNMLAGVGGIEVSLLVVASDEGPMPQTVQHVKILSLLGVKAAVVALTKSDLVESERAAVVEGKVRALLARYDIDVAALVSVSSTTGEGIDTLQERLAEVVIAHAGLQSKVHSGSAQAKTLDPAAAGKIPGYLPIDRVFAKSGYGTVVTGTLVEGGFKVGDQVTVEPGGFGGRVRGLETFGKAQELACSGQRLAMNITLKDNKAVLSRGLCVLGGAKEITSDLVVQISDYGIDNSPESVEISRKMQLSSRPVKLYHGTMEAPGFLRWIESVPCDTPSRELAAVGHIHLEQPMVVSPGDRYVLRYGDDGIAGGVVLLCQKPRWLTRSLVRELTPFLLAGKSDKAVLFILNNHPGKAVRFNQLSWVLREERQKACLESLVQEHTVENIGGFMITRTVKEAVKAKAIAALNTILKNEDKNVTGVNLETIRRMAAANLDRQIMQELLKELAAAGLLVRKEDRLFGPSGAIEAPTLDAYTTSILNLLDKVVCLEITELAKLSKSEPKQVKAAVERLAKVKMAQVIDNEFASSKKWIDFSHNKLLKIWQEKKDISPADFRDELATTRKYALALLAYFDDHQITRRTTSGRALLKQPK
ncbi:MAG: selenocysteine-specific translation elongation factor [Cyanobacteria bacterium REEB67]|nr:selenocysteine-specific translation elongation factor [Cyanobacteria bacterium REEB67]